MVAVGLVLVGVFAGAELETRVFWLGGLEEFLTSSQSNSVRCLSRNGSPAAGPADDSLPTSWLSLESGENSMLIRTNRAGLSMGSER